MHTSVGPVRPSTARWTLALLVLANVLSVGDRMLLGVVTEPVRIEIGLSDLQMALANGPIFVLFHLSAGFFIARLVDRGVRMRILAACIAAWSLATAGTGLAHDFTALAAARVGVGIAEAAVFPVAMSLIPDLFATQVRGRAMAVFQTSGFLGIMVCTSLAGVLAGSLGWRPMFMIFGAAGIVLSAIVWMSGREPARVHPAARKSASPPYMADLLAACRRVLGLPGFPSLVLAFGVAAMVAAATGAWAPAFLQRSHGVSLADVGLAMGLASGIGGIAGTLLAGVLIDRVGRRSGHVSGMLQIPVVCLPLCVPLLLGFVLSPSAGLTVACLGAMSFVLGCAVAPCLTCAMSYVAPADRGVASIVMLLAAGVIGSALGPLTVGAASELLDGRLGDESLRHALGLLVAAPVAAALLLMSSRGQLQEGLPHGPGRMKTT